MSFKTCLSFGDFHVRFALLGVFAEDFALARLTIFELTVPFVGLPEATCRGGLGILTAVVRLFYVSSWNLYF